MSNTGLATINDIDEKVENFKQNFLDCINKHAPLKKISYKNLFWLTEKIKCHIKERDKFKKVWKRNRNEVAYVNFKKLRNKVHLMMR